MTHLLRGFNITDPWRRWFIATLVVMLFPVTAKSAPPARLYLLDAAELETLQNDVGMRAATVAEAEKQIDQAIEPVTVKRRAPPSGDRRDYSSQSPYFWPNPKTADGLPYIRKDGQRNPDSREDSDVLRLRAFCSRTRDLAVAYYLTRDERFADQAVENIRVFLLDDTTGMHPHLRYAGAIPGTVEGRGIAIVDAKMFPEALDAAELLAGSKAWSSEVKKPFRQWCSDYLDWLNKSKFGREALRNGNNIATHHDVQRVALTLYLDRTDDARQLLEEAKQRHIEGQIAADGSQPHELKRTRALGYSVSNLRGLLALARMGKLAGVDLWHYESPKGSSLRKAIDFVAPYRDPAKKWPYQQIVPLDRAQMDPLLRQAARAYEDPKYTELSKQFASAGQ